MRQNIFDSIPSDIVSSKDNVFANFLQTAGLYESMKIDEDNIEELILLLDGKVRISAYCKECKEERVFTMKPYIYFQDNDNECYSKKLSEEVWRIQQLRILENTPQVGGFVKEQNTVWKWKEPQTEEVSRILIGLQGVESIYNSDIIKKASDILSAIGNEILKIGEAVTQIESTSLEFADVVEMLSKKIDGLSDEFAEIKREIKDDTLDIDGFVKMTEELEKCKENLKQLDERAKSKKQIESAFKKAMRERNDILLEQFNAYKLEIQKINESQNELKITIDFKGDRDNFKSQMKTDFRGSGISEIKYQSLCDTFRDYVELIEDWILCDGMKIKEIISSSEYTKLDKKLQDQYADLLKNQVSNNVEIYYHDKLLRHHSIGQRASALILFILMQSDNDIILIDQPEDDLDNKIIYDEVITAIAKKKQEIQFIFATHNANIPVLGDAERIFVVEYQDTTIDISQGNIDLKSTHKQIVDIMEGGEEAFDKRQLIYTSWK